MQSNLKRYEIAAVEQNQHAKQYYGFISTDTTAELSGK
jgi:hypothetical protein